MAETVTIAILAILVGSFLFPMDQSMDTLDTQIEQFADTVGVRVVSQEERISQLKFRADSLKRCQNQQAREDSVDLLCDEMIDSCLCEFPEAHLFGISESHGAEPARGYSPGIHMGYIGAFPEQSHGIYFVICPTALPNPRIGLYFDGMVSKLVPDEKIYNFSKERAENFYKSKYMGNQRESSSFGLGFAYLLMANQEYAVIPYGAIKFYHYSDYRKYHDDTFTVWQNDYFLKDMSNGDLGISFGFVIKVTALSLNFGYDGYDHHNNWKPELELRLPIGKQRSKRIVLLLQK